MSVPDEIESKECKSVLEDVVLLLDPVLNDTNKVTPTIASINDTTSIPTTATPTHTASPVEEESLNAVRKTTSVTAVEDEIGRASCRERV